MGALRSRYLLPLQAATLAAAVVGVGLQPAWGRIPAATVHHHYRHRPVHQAAPQPWRLRLPAADDFSNERGGDRDFGFAPPPSFRDRPPTAIDYELAPRGPVGSVGLLHPGDTHAAASTNLGQTTTLRRGYPEVTAGAKLSYPF
jgi:hypothetical protein